MATNRDYWIQRERENLQREIELDRDKIATLEQIITDAQKETEKEVERLIGRYATAENLTKEEAQMKIDAFDVQDFQETVAKYVQNRDFSERANRELRLYNVSMQTSREKLIRAYLNVHLVAMTDQKVAEMQQYLMAATTREFERQAAILGSSALVSTEAVEALVGASFQGAKFSTRIWNDHNELKRRLYTTLNNALVRGVHPYKDVPAYREAFGVNRYQARRLLITETARVQVEAQKLSYEENDILKYEYLAIIDNKTTKKCEGLHNEVFLVSEMVVGVTCPPVHPFCRSTTIPAIED